MSNLRKYLSSLNDSIPIGKKPLNDWVSGGFTELVAWIKKEFKNTKDKNGTKIEFKLVEFEKEIEDDTYSAFELETETIDANESTSLTVVEFRSVYLVSADGDKYSLPECLGVSKDDTEKTLTEIRKGISEFLELWKTSS